MDKADKTSVLEETTAVNTRPHPNDFVVYLPWACNQLELEDTVVVIKAYQSDYVGSSSDRSKSKSKTRPIRSRVDTTSDRDVNKTQQAIQYDGAVYITAVYDTNEDLVQIIFNNNKCVPRILLKTIAMIIKFYPQLSSIMIDRGADLYTVYELGKMLTLSNITDVCLDDCSVNGANYDILLDQESLRQLSLCRCHIIDEYIDKIAGKLIHPLPASKSLSILNLTSNRITDIGAKSIGNALRSNRCLTYLNLSDNWLTDNGAIEIFNSLQEFCMTPNEVLSSKSRYISYLRRRNDLITSKVKEIKEGDSEKTAKRKTGRSTPTSVRRKTKASDRDGSFQSVRDAVNLNCSDPNLLDKVLTIVQTTLGDFTDPFSSNHTIVKDEVLYCLGNNTLCYLSLAYNDLSYLLLNKLLSVLSYQRKVDRKPCGLVYVCIEGNNMPVVCEELQQINQLLESGIQRSCPVNKKQRQAKTTGK